MNCVNERQRWEGGARRDQIIWGASRPSRKTKEPVRRCRLLFDKAGDSCKPFLALLRFPISSKREHAQKYKKTATYNRQVTHTIAS